MTMRMNAIKVIAGQKLYETLIYPGFYVAMTLSLAIAFVLVYGFATSVGSSGFDPGVNPVYELISKSLAGVFGQTFADKTFSEGPFLFTLVVSFLPVLVYLAMSSAFRFGFEKSIGALELIAYGPADGTAYILASLAKDLACTAVFLVVLLSFFAISALVFNLVLGATFFLAFALLFFLAFAVYAYGILASVVTDNEASSVALFIALFVFFAFIYIGSFALAGGYVKDLAGTLAWIAQWFSPLFFWNAGLDSADGGNYLLCFGSLACTIALGVALLFLSHVILRAKGVRA